MKHYLFLGLVSLLLWSCGGNEASSDSSTATPVTVKKEPAAVTKEEPVQTQSTSSETDESFDIEIDLAGNDQMQYDKKEIRVKEGQKVKLNLSHSGKLPKEAMGHNFVLLAEFVGIPYFAAQAAKAKKNDYIPEETEDIIAHTKMLGGGESTTIYFDAPKKGTYDFICTFPGHYGLMQGKFIVE